MDFKRTEETPNILASEQIPSLVEEIPHVQAAAARRLFLAPRDRCDLDKPIAFIWHFVFSLEAWQPRDLLPSLSSKYCLFSKQRPADVLEQLRVPSPRSVAVSQKQII